MLQSEIEIYWNKTSTNVVYIILSDQSRAWDTNQAISHIRHLLTTQTCTEACL